MNIIQRVANKFIPSQQNTMGRELAQDFLRNGPQRLMYPDFSQVIMAEEDKYTGFMYGSIMRRVNKVAWLAQYNLMTKANDATDKAAKQAKQTLVHPYLKLIDESPSFANDAFWRTIQTYMDIRGIFYLMAIRGQADSAIDSSGTKKVTSFPKEFKLLNAYNITEVWDANQQNLIGYIEVDGTRMRQIPPEMIIPIKTLNPFNWRKPFAMADAARDAQFSLKETNEQVTTAARRNRKYPGVVVLGTGGAKLDPNQVENFKAKMRGKGESSPDEPIFSSTGQGGKGTITWNDMQIDLRKSAVDVTSEIQINSLIAVTGTSKTKMGIEQSGVTRDTAAIQDDLFVEDQGMPSLQLIIDALNQDYKTNYADEYTEFGYNMYIDSPLKEDKDAELTDVTNRTNTFDLYQTLLDKGYDSDTAAAYASGDKPLTDIGEPTNPPKKVDPVVTPPVAPPQDPKIEPPISGKESFTPSACTCKHNHQIPAAIINSLDPKTQSQIEQSAGALKNTIISIEHQVVAAVLNKVTKNDFDGVDDIIDASARDAAEQQLETALAAFYGIVMPLAGQTTIDKRLQEFKLLGSFKLDAETNGYISVTASRAAGSHIDTILKDILDTVRTTETRIVQGEVKKIVAKPGQTPEDILVEARRMALEGPGRQQLAAAIKQEYSDTISKVRAQTIATTETNRAFNRSQFEADRQFLAENDLTGRAYKKWVTRSSHPCPYCLAKAAQPPIPFNQDFARVGDTLTATFQKTDGGTSVRQMKVGFEDVQAGNLHPLCECTYQLVIEQEQL